jgi:hypothetical protein
MSRMSIAAGRTTLDLADTTPFEVLSNTIISEHPQNTGWTETNPEWQEAPIHP